MASKANLIIDQGDTYSVTLNVTDDSDNVLDLAGYTVSSKMRKWYTSNTAVLFNCSTNVASGSVTLGLDANTTLGIAPGRYVYDVIITKGNTVMRILEGLVTVTPGVSVI
jgi:hypothetical protein